MTVDMDVLTWLLAGLTVVCVAVGIHEIIKGKK